MQIDFVHKVRGLSSIQEEVYMQIIITEFAKISNPLRLLTRASQVHCCDNSNKHGSSRN
jgi:hypothetical protein